MADVGSSPGTGAGEQLFDRVIVSGQPVECRIVSSRTVSADCDWSSDHDGPHIFLRLCAHHVVPHSCNCHKLILMR